MTLLLSTDFMNLPSEPKARWLALRDLVESRLNETEDPQHGFTIEDIIEYSHILSSAASALGVGELTPLKTSYEQNDYRHFRGEVVGLATTLALQSSDVAKVISVELKRTTKEKIFAQIEQLRTSVKDSSLSDKAKAKAHSKLDELHIAIVAPRTDYATVFSVFAHITTASASTVTGLALLPDAIATVTTLIGADKEAEEVKLLERSDIPKAIPHFQTGDAGDEIPF